MSALHIHGYFLVSSPPYVSSSVLTMVALVQSLTAGIVEEIVVLGYVVRRLEQRGYPVAVIVIIDVVIRVSYHLYYGWGVIPILCWAIVSVCVYLRVKRLLPFILCHVAWDAAISLRYYKPHFYSYVEIAAVGFAIITFLLWNRWSPRDVITDHAP